MKMAFLELLHIFIHNLTVIWIITFLFHLKAVDKCRTELKKIQKKASKNHSEKYVEKEQKSSEELQHLTKQLYDFRNEGLRDVSIKHGNQRVLAEQIRAPDSSSDKLYSAKFGFESRS